MATDPYSGVNSDFALNLHQLVSMVGANGLPLSISSGFRTEQQQQQLYNQAVQKYGAVNANKWAAVPGTSNHERGLAVDLSGSAAALQMAHQLAGQLGLNFPLSNEPWHVEPIGASQTHNNSGGPPVNGVTGADSQGDTPVDRVSALIQTLSGKQTDSSMPTTTDYSNLPDVTKSIPVSYGATPSAMKSFSSGKAVGAIRGSNAYDAVFQSAGQKYGIDPAVLKAVAHQESGFNPNARSGAGAIGLMQFMPGTAKGLGINPLDPSQAIDGAARLLSSYEKQFGGLDAALAAYNAGPGAVKKYGGVPPYAETQNYVRSINSMLH